MTIPVTCPSDKFPKDEKKPKIEVLTFCLEAKATNSCNVSDNIAKVLGVEDRLRRLGPSLKIIRSNINLVKLEGRKQSYFVRCPRFPSDPDARIGVGKDRRDPNREEKIFGYDAIFGTSIEPDLHLEIPISCLTSSGNADERSYLPLIIEQIKQHHPKTHPKTAPPMPNTIYWKTIGKLQLPKGKWSDSHHCLQSKKRGSIPCRLKKKRL